MPSLDHRQAVPDTATILRGWMQPPSTVRSSSLVRPLARLPDGPRGSCRTGTSPFRLPPGDDQPPISHQQNNRAFSERSFFPVRSSRSSSNSCPISHPMIRQMDTAQAPSTTTSQRTRKQSFSVRLHQDSAHQGRCTFEERLPQFSGSLPGMRHQKIQRFCPVPLPKLATRDETGLCSTPVPPPIPTSTITPSTTTDGSNTTPTTPMSTDNGTEVSLSPPSLIRSVYRDECIVMESENLPLDIMMPLL